MGSDEEKAVDMLSRNRSIHQSCIEKSNGTLIKEIGDGILASFSLASEAVRCAIEIQKECKEQDIPLKIGIHEGEMIFSGSDVIGDGVNIASRLQEDAQEGCINISASVYRDIKNKADIQTKFIGEKIFKNVDEPIKVYRVLLDDSEIDDLSSFDYQKLQKKQKKLTYNLIIGVIAAIIIIILFWMYLPVNEESEKEKSIAVMPFDNESDDTQNEYFVNGMMEDIRNNLSIIGDLRVISKTSTEKYRETSLSTKEIAEELDVNYLLEGTVQKQGNQVKIHAQLIEAKIDDHIWTKTYLRDISEVFEVQSEIAQIIAKELYSTITPLQKEILETIPTTNLTAYDFFLRARDVHTNYWLDNNNKNALEKAITLYNRSLEYDSTYAQAYTGLAIAYFDKHYWGTYFEEDFMDSSLILSNIALSYDNQLSEAYYIRGRYFREARGEYKKALNDFDKAIFIDPSYSWAYYQRGNLYLYNLGDNIKAIKNYHKAAILDHSFLLPTVLRNLCQAYDNSGFINKVMYYQQEALKLDSDSSKYFLQLGGQEYNKGNFEVSSEYYNKCFQYDSSRDMAILMLVTLNNILGNNLEAYNYALKLIELVDSKELITSMHRIGYAFWQVGKQEEAKYYFDNQIKYCLESIRLNRWYAINKSAHYDLAGVYAFLGEKEKAYQYLDELVQRKSFPAWWIDFARHDPLFNSIREEERFQKIYQNMEAKFQKEHDRVKAWLEEEGML